MNYIIAPHPDDEILGAGGVLLSDPTAFTVLYVTMGNDDQEESAKAFCKAHGIKFYWLGLHECELDDMLAVLVAKLAESVVDADTVYIPCERDYHIDHQITARACRSVLKPWKGRARRVLEYEVLSETPPGWVPTTYRKITSNKVDAMACFYQLEAIQSRSAAAVDALAVLRGAESGLGYAEAFRLWYEVTR